MSHPFQCLLYCRRPGQPNAGVLVAASGPNIHTFSVEDGANLDTWPSNGVPKTSDQTGEDIDHVTDAVDGATYHQEDRIRPQKRRKLSPPREDSGSSAEIVVNDGGSANGGGAKMQKPSCPSVTKLAATSSGQYVVAVTGEDKCLRVFELSRDGCLKPLSERIMPKRPCAVVLTPDDKTILCADKFGDIYSLPLLGQTYDSAAGSDTVKSNTNNTADDHPKSKLFVPVATSLTVHTKGNREALRQQQKITNPKAEKKSLNFDHQLLLGHVSLLTDVICVSMDRHHERPRTYILSSDRDEHIRVSRGMPQAHIIEGYCLGHTQFVSKLCFSPAHPRFLLSGGGDDYLLLWEWQSGEMLQKIDLRGPVEAFSNDYESTSTYQKCLATNGEANATEESAEINIAVSNIQTRKDPTPGTPMTDIIVTCEGIPGLFVFSLREDAEVLFKESIPLAGNIVDFVFPKDQTSIIYSMDHIHEPFSRSKVVDEQEQQTRPLVGVDWRPDAPEKEKRPYAMLLASMDRCARLQAFVEPEAPAKGRSTRELLYGLEGLRKWGGEGNEIGVD